MAHDFVRFPELTNGQMQFYYMDSPHVQIFDNFEAKVTRVQDGDTVTLSTDFRDFEFPLRIADMAAPELSQEGGLESQAFMTEQVLGKEVTIVVSPENRVGKFGRLIGRVMSEGINVGQQSMQFGFAVPFGSSQAGVLDLDQIIGDFE